MMMDPVAGQRPLHFVDLHCHWLPGVDDGARTVSEALDLARASVQDGIGWAVLTPHIYFPMFPNTATSLRALFEAFRNLLVESGVPIHVELAAEVRLDADTLDLLDRGEIPLLGDAGIRSHLLLELPDSHVPMGTVSFCEHLLENDIRPVIAHPERNKEIMRATDRARTLSDAGCLLQLTAGSLIGDFGAQVQLTALRLIEDGQIALVASDCHNLRSRPPRMSKAWAELDRLYGAAYADELTIINPGWVVGKWGGHEHSEPQ